MAAEPEVNWAEWKGKRWAIRDALGDIALYQLHDRFEANATAAAEWLGFSDRAVVRDAWAAKGLACKGRDKPRRGANLAAFQQWPETPLEEISAAYREYSRQQERALAYAWDLPANARIGILIGICDLHGGHGSCDWDRFLTLRDWIKRHSQSRWFLGGDNLEVNTKAAPGHSSEQYLPTNVARELVTHELRPIASQGICLYEGNHEGRLQRDTDTDVSIGREMADDLGIAYMGICGHIIHQVGGEQYIHFHHHGRGAARTEAAKLKMGLDVGDTVMNELVTVGHAHFEVAVKRQRRQVQADLSVENWGQRVVMCPSFLQYRGYPATQALHPSSLGVLSIHLGAQEHQIRVME